MKRLTIMAAALMLASGAAMAGVANTGHDLTDTDTWDTGSDELCVHCHTPHNPNTKVPLWNHSLTTGETYLTYTSDTMTASLNQDPGFATGITRLCLSCHDGTVTVGTVTNPPQRSAGVPTPAAALSGNALLGTDLTSDHPVGFVYSIASNADSDINTFPSTAPASGVLLFDGRVECASCHDPHNDTVGQEPFLVGTNAASAICTTCHSK